jgi:hypothetical protein
MTLGGITMKTFMHNIKHNCNEIDYTEKDYAYINDCYNIQNSCIFLGNFNKEEKPLYEKAIALYNDKTLFICEKAYTNFGGLLKDYNALWGIKNKDYSAFWRCFETVKETT